MSEKRFLAFTFLVFSIIALSFGKSNKKAVAEDPFVVVLDAGHGGHDPGNLGNGYLEKNIALGIVLKVGALLEKQPNIKVVYTRKDDTFVDLFVRGQIANKANADLFVSIHCDSHTSNAYGAGTFVLGLHANRQNFEIAKKENSVIYLEDDYETRYADYDINSPESVIGLTIMQEEFLEQSILLAKIMQEHFTGKLKRNDRKVKQAGFIVLHQTFMPSVLVETGFLTNKNEGAYLNSQKGQSQMGKAIADAIMEYRGRIKANVADVPLTVTPAPSPDSGKPDKEITKEEVSKITENTPETVSNPVKEKIKENAQESNIGADVAKSDVVKEITEMKPKAQPPQKEVPAEMAKKTAEEVDKETTSTITKASEKIVFKVQLMASSKDIGLVPGNFNGLNRISKEPYKNLFRYLYGSTALYEEAKMLKSNADLKGYPTSYIVAYKDGERIPLKEALKYVDK